MCKQLNRFLNRTVLRDGRVVFNSTADLGEQPPANAVFLGTVAGGRHVWAVRAPLAPPEDTDANVLDLRRGGTDFDDLSATLVATATALLNWHDNARFSAINGAPTKVVKAGWSRIDPVSGHEEFPRIDPRLTGQRCRHVFAAARIACADGHRGWLADDAVDAWL